mmetsp:Transcript_27864/g.44657  ORF Transcript_27864/g.44657 Transcript_27864/m.44657 type:complete len:95 (+) Transcript_27864:1079-1363(+)
MACGPPRRCPRQPSLIPRCQGGGLKEGFQKLLPVAGGWNSGWDTRSGGYKMVDALLVADRSQWICHFEVGPKICNFVSGHALVGRRTVCMSCND